MKEQSVTSCIATTPVERNVPDVYGITVSTICVPFILTVAYFKREEALYVEEEIALTKEPGDSPTNVGMIDISSRERLPAIWKGIDEEQPVECIEKVRMESFDDGETKAIEEDPESTTLSLLNSTVEFRK